MRSFFEPGCVSTALALGARTAWSARRSAVLSRRLGTGCPIPFRALLESALALGFLAGLLVPSNTEADFVYETPAEFLTAGDFNGDGVLDVLVLDKASGNARVGYQNPNDGALTWSLPLVTGVENVTGCAVGRFLTTVADAVAVTAPDFNRIYLVSLGGTNAAGPPVLVTPIGLGPHTLVALANPTGGVPPAFNSLLCASSFNAAPDERLDLFALNAGMATPAGPFAESASFERGNALTLAANGPTLVVGLVRGTNDGAFLKAELTSRTNSIASLTGGTNDTLHLWQFSNAPAAFLPLSNLPPGSDYALGSFRGEDLPRFAFYVPGQSSLSVQPLLTSGSALVFGDSVSVPFTEAVQRVFYLERGADGSFIVQFGNGIQALGFAGGARTLGSHYQSGLGGAGNGFTGIIPLDDGRLALLDAPTGSGITSHAQVLHFDGTNYSLLSAGYLPSPTAPNTRANFWFFQSEPFVSSDPVFVSSIAVPDWTDRALGTGNLYYGGSLNTEADRGPSSGLGNLMSTGYLPAPSGAFYGLPNQYDEAISLFSYGSARAPEPLVTITPPAGTYASPLQVFVSTSPASYVPLYRAGTRDTWHVFTGTPFWLTNDVTVQYYATNYGVAGDRSPLFSARYSLGHPDVTPPPPQNVNPDQTNGVPANPNPVQLSTKGTLFYSRRSETDAGTIWAINLDGTDDTYITAGARPRASRDGRYIAFLHDGSPFSSQGNIWRRDLVTGQEDLLFVNTDVVVGFDWFGDDSALIIDFACALYKLSTNTTLSPYVVADQCYDNAPVLSPVDGRVAFHNTNSVTGGLYLAAANGSGRTNILGQVDGAFPAWPAWSHDGAQLAVGQSATGPNKTRNLYLINPDGTGLDPLTGFSDPTNGWPSGAIWFPSDNALIGAGEIHGTNGLWILPLNSSRTACEGLLTRLPTSPGDAIDFAGTIVVAPTPVPVPPGLFIRLEPEKVVVYWHTNSPGFYLEAAEDVFAPGSWTSVAGPFSVAGSYHEYAQPRASLRATRFFRLHRKGPF
jgi:hypothetical protein